MSSIPQSVSIEEMATKLGLPHHLILFWQKKFTCFRMTFRQGEGQMIAVSDAPLVAGIYTLLQNEGCTLRDIQRLLKQRGISHVASFGRTMVSEADKFDGVLPSDSEYDAQLNAMTLDDEDDDLDTTLDIQEQMTAPSEMWQGSGLSSAGGTGSGRPPLGSGIGASVPVGGTFGLTHSLLPDPIASLDLSEQRVSIFDIATGAQPSPSIATGTTSVSATEANIETLVRERTATLLSDPSGVGTRAETASLALSSYNDKIDVIQFPAPHKMRHAIQGLNQTLQKLDTLQQELIDLEGALKDGLQTMGYSGFRTAYKDYDERRFDALDPSVL